MLWITETIKFMLFFFVTTFLFYALATPKWYFDLHQKQRNIFMFGAF